MIKTRQVSKLVFVKEFVVCNKCGFEQKIDEIDNGRDFTDIRNTAGYCSNHDGEIFSSNICEPCMLAFYATFKISPLVIPANPTLEQLRKLEAEREGEIHVVTGGAYDRDTN